MTPGPERCSLLLHSRRWSEALSPRALIGMGFNVLCLGSTLFGLLVLVVLLGVVLWHAWPRLDWQFLSSFDSAINPDRAGILAGIWGSLWLILFTVLFSVPVGVGAALYLEEYAKGTWLTRLIQVNLSNLAGVPSIVYGILGLTVFVRQFGVFSKGEHSRFAQFVAHVLGTLGSWLHLPSVRGATVLTGALTMSLLVLPVVIIATQEALRAVPSSVRHASYALGATRWQTIWHQVLPAALPGILTGVILAISRAIGETAPLVMIGIPMFYLHTPGKITNAVQLFNPHAWAAIPFAKFTALPMQIFNWVKDPNPAFQQVAAAGIVVLLGLLLLLNTAAIVIRQRFQRRIRW